MSLLLAARGKLFCQAGAVVLAVEENVHTVPNIPIYILPLEIRETQPIEESSLISPSRGLGAEIARAFAAEGSNIAINYFSASAPAEKLASELSTTHGVKTATLQADAGSPSAITSLVQNATQALGGLDIVIANAGWTRFSDFNDLDALSDEEWDRCWKTNVLGVKALAAAAVPVFNSNAEGGVVLVTSSIAGRSIGGSSMAYSVTKAAQLHLVKCVAKTQGAKVRCNAVLPGLLLTEWGLEYGDERIKALKEAAVLQKEVRCAFSLSRSSNLLRLTYTKFVAVDWSKLELLTDFHHYSQTDLQDCANMFVSLAKNTSITGQHIQIDSGLAIQHL